MFYKVKKPDLDVKKQDLELLDFLARGIAFLEKKPAGLTPEEQRSELPKLREWHRTLAESLGTTASAPPPWESVQTIVDVADANDGVRGIVRPVVSGRVAYALGMDWDQSAAQVSFTLLKFDLDDHSTKERGTFTLENLASAVPGKSRSLEDGEINQLTAIERSTSEGSYFIRSACIAGDNYYAATLGRGIVVFPLKGGLPHRIDEAGGLPSDFVQCLTAHHGIVYAWLGQPRKAAYLVRLKTDGTDIQVIVSSRRTIKKTPLDNVAPVLCDFMMVDQPRDRIVFRLTSNGSDDTLGFWELALANDTVRQMQRTHLVLAGHPPRSVSDDQILVKDGFLARRLDLKTGMLRPVVRHETQYSGNFQPIALMGDKVWINFPFGSIDVKTQKIEFFPNLRAPAPGKTFQPGVFFEKVGVREFLLGDSAGLWLIKMKPAEPQVAE
jgi:hypothetical protein